MGEPLEGVNVPKDWIGQTVLVLSHTVGQVTTGEITAGEAMLPESGYSLVANIYSGELRVVNSLGVSQSLLSSIREEGVGSFYPGRDTFFPWNSVVRISLAALL